MTNNHEIDLVVICVRVPGHKELVTAGLRANKAVFCEWPLGATLSATLHHSGPANAYALSDLEGLLQGQTDTTETDIDAVLYQVPPAMDADT
jgi:hypothetical protein